MSVVKIKSWLASLCVLALVGCGGGSGGSAGDPLLGGGTTTTTTTVAKLQVKFDTAAVDNTGTQNAIATVTALDANGQGVQGVLLTLKVDNNATFNVTSSGGNTTGADGTVLAAVTIGNDYSLRTITMTAGASGVLESKSTLQVTGSREAASDLTVTAATSILNSVSSNLTVTATAVDANRNALPNIPVTFSVDSGATIVPSGTVTGPSGTISGVLRIGQDQSNRTIKVVATSGTVTRTVNVLVTGAKLSSSGVASTVGVGSTGNRITYVLVDNANGKMAGYPITVKASGVVAVSGVTDVDGAFVYSYTAPAAAQSMLVEAAAGGAIAQDTISVTGTVVIPPAAVAVASPSVSVSPNVVAVNPLGAGTVNKVEVRALFLGANNAPVKNVRVWFDLDGDKQSIGGTFDSTAAGALLYSDVNGVARTTYAPGSRFSPKDGVTVRACWAAGDFAVPVEGGVCPNAVRATLTVVSESLSVSIGTNGTIGIGSSALTYTKRYAVQVVDSSGQAKAGVQVSPSIDLLTYYKGYFTLVSEVWTQGGLGNVYPTVYPDAVTPVPGAALATDTFTATWTRGNVARCDNEDLNRNGVGETFFDSVQGALVPEDQNGSGNLSPQRPMLDPRKADVTIAIEGSTTTDANGIVVLKIEYPQNVGSWVRVNILVSASGVAGTEGRANYEGVLPVLASALTSKDVPPPFLSSPYGVLGSDTYKRQNPEGQVGWLCSNPN
jgi:hypothetical protein